MKGGAMNTARRWAFAATLLLACGTSVADELTEEKRADIQRLMEMTGAANLARQMASAAASQIGQMIRKSKPQTPQRAIDVLPAEIGAVYDAHMTEFTAMLVPIYDKYFTAGEIKEMIAFYSTPLGRKTVSVLPQLSLEAMEAGQKWGQSLGPEVVERIKARLKKEGIE
jgi:hypothetical protein